MSVPNKKTIYINPNISTQKPNNVHINPLFKHVHINPLFKVNTRITEIQNQRPSSVHINPKVFQQLAPKTECNVTVKQTQGSSTVSIPTPVVDTLQTSFHSAIKTNPYLFVSDRKLIKSEKPPVNSNDSVFVKKFNGQIIKAPSYSINRQNVVNLSKFPSRDQLKKVATENFHKPTTETATYQRLRRTSLKSKYKLIHSNKKVLVEKKPVEKSKYKIDRRLNKTIRRHSFKKDKFHILPSTSKTGQIEKKLPVSNKRLINIGGVFYKSTKQKLCLSENVNKTITSVKKLNKCIVTVQGAKYVLDQNAKTLKKIFDSEITKKSPLKRINVGGVTYMTKNETTLIKMATSKNSNKSFSKQRINLRKNNMICLLFQRYGYCKRKDLGRCNKVHDEKRIAMCKDFLRGSCTKLDCKLSHKPSLEKMPVCLHYLSGTCVRDDCLYLHVKHNDSVPICDQFVRGFCDLADKCKRRHEFLCPDFDKFGKCTKLKCPLPHKAKSKKVALKANKPKSIKINDNVLKEENNKRYQENVNDIKKRQEENIRYFEDGPSKNNTSEESDNVNAENCDTEEVEAVSITNEDVEPVAKRPKLGILPAYIPL